jgi:uncharacterized membrane protein YhaH (DUF805 family)
VSFADAVKSVFGQYTNFSGRARRSEYWYFLLFVVLIEVVAFIATAAVAIIGILIFIAMLGLIVPALAVAVRRMHDTGRSGWFLLCSLIPFVGGLVVLYFAIQPSQPAPNQYGPIPQ